MEKKKLARRYIYRFVCDTVFLILAVCSFDVSWYQFVSENNQTGHLLGHGNLLMAIIIYGVLFYTIRRWLGAFRIGVERKAKCIVGLVVTILMTNSIEVFVSMAITGQFRFAGQFGVIYFWLSIIQIIVLGFLMVFMIDVYWLIIPPLKLLVIEGEYQNFLPEKIADLKHKYQVSKIISASLPDDELEKEIEKSEAVLINDVVAKKQNSIVKKCFELDKRVYVVPKLSEIILKTSENLNVLDTPLYLCRNMGMKLWQRLAKRIFDIVFSILALFLFSPILLITAIAIKLEDGGPVFFTQERITRGGKHFKIFKFRSMIVDAEKDGKPHPAGVKDDRITKVGHLIRACRIDEMPQFFNILKGDMSLVGPRPERCEHVEKYSAEIPEFQYRHKVKGGLTGYAQVYGKYNTSALDKLKLDLIYITNYSLLLDFQIICETLKILFEKESTEGFGEEQIEEIFAAERYK